MATEKTRQQRNRIRLHLEGVVGYVKLINEIMKDLPHKGGLVYRRLKLRSDEYIVRTPSGISSVYKDSDGKLYEINICRRDKR